MKLFTTLELLDLYWRGEKVFDYMDIIIVTYPKCFTEKRPILFTNLIELFDISVVLTIPSTCWMSNAPQDIIVNRLHYFALAACLEILPCSSTFAFKELIIKCHLYKHKELTEDIKNLKVSFLSHRNLLSTFSADVFILTAVDALVKLIRIKGSSLVLILDYLPTLISSVIDAYGQWATQAVTVNKHRYSVIMRQRLKNRLTEWFFLIFSDPFDKK